MGLEENHRGQVLRAHARGMCCQHDPSLVADLGQPGQGFSMVKGPPIPHPTPWKQVAVCSPSYPQRGEIELLLPEEGVPTYNLESFYWKICLFSQMDLFIQSFIYTGMDSWIFILEFGL